MNKFELANATVDTTRGEITVAGDSKTVEPKVLAVLMLLVEANGEVISQEDIFDAIWPNSIFSQNSVQRCIAILRKLLEDDAKRQAVIVTHPKRGYSLTPKAVKLTRTHSRKTQYPYIALIFFILITALSINFWSNDNEALKTQVQEAQLIGATADNEFQPQLISTQHLSYIRHEEGKGQAIWLYDLTQQREVRLTSYALHIGSYQWLNPQTLLYAKVNDQQVEIHRRKVDLENFYANNSEAASTSTDIIVDLFNINIFRGFYLTQDNQLIYQAVITGVSQLRQYDLGSGLDTLLLNESEKFKPYGFAVNSLTAEIAIIGFNDAKATEVKLLLLAKDGVRLHTITTLDSNIYHIDWQEKHNRLLLTEGKKLVNLSLTGEVEDINYNTTAFMQQAAYDPEGQHLVFTQQVTDSDLWLGHRDKDDAIATSHMLVNSTASDYGGAFSPNGNRVAYISNRNGFPQIYVTNITSGSTEVIFNNPERKLLLSPPLWHPSKELIVSAVSEKLLMIDLLAGTEKWQIIEDTVLSPLAWYQDENALLVIDMSNNKNMLSKYDLVNHHLKAISENTYAGAMLGNQDNLIKLTQNEIIDSGNGVENIQRIAEGNIVTAMRTPKGIYLQIAQEQQQSLTFYSFDTQRLSKPQSLPEEMYMIWDIHPIDQRLLFETSTTNQDIVLLRLN
jgi:DNA-binding winged helix-turn-helix (wHTH) protein